MPNPRTNLPLLAAGFVLLWNSGFIGTEYALPSASAFTQLFWRYVALTLILLLFLAWRRRLYWPGMALAGHTALVGVLAHGVWLSCVLVAVERGVPAGIVALVVALQPLATGVFSGIATGERTSARQWAGLALGFGGVAVAVGARVEWTDSASIFAYLIPLGSVVAITFASLLQRRRDVLGRTRLPLDLTLFYQGLATAVMLAIPALAVERMATNWTPEFIATLAWLIFAVSLGAYALMWRLLARVDAVRVASLFYLGPPVTMLMAWIAFGDHLLTTDVVGLIIAAAGVFLVQTRGRQSG